MQKKKIKYYYEKGKDYNSQKMEEQKRKKNGDDKDSI